MIPKIRKSENFRIFPKFSNFPKVSEIFQFSENFRRSQKSENPKISENPKFSEIFQNFPKFSNFPFLLCFFTLLRVTHFVCLVNPKGALFEGKMVNTMTNVKVAIPPCFSPERALLGCKMADAMRRRKWWQYHPAAI